jgi:hypothetical protein
VHDGFVVVADDPAQLRLDRGEDALLGGLQDGQMTVRAVQGPVDG